MFLCVIFKNISLLLGFMWLCWDHIDNPRLSLKSLLPCKVMYSQHPQWTFWGAILPTTTNSVTSSFRCLKPFWLNRSIISSLLLFIIPVKKYHPSISKDKSFKVILEISSFLTFYTLFIAKSSDFYLLNFIHIYPFFHFHRSYPPLASFFLTLNK